MQAWALEMTRDCRGEAARLDCLQRAMFSADLGFDYAHDETLTAAQAWWAQLEGDLERADRHARRASRLRGTEQGPVKPR